MAVKKNLVIVESPAKAKTLKKFLGSNYKIEATMGHVRDLPKSEMGINIEDDFEPKYITIRGKGEVLAKLRKEVKTANKIYLATDPDREGEAISWHLLYALKLNENSDKNVYRITFNEITKNAVQKSIKEAREIDMNLVDAQQARRALDRIVGYKISPLLWKKIKKGLSAGRVQSVALRLICDRDDEIENFIPDEYWTIDVDLKAEKNKVLKTKFYGKDDKKMEVSSEGQVDEILKGIKDSKFVVNDVKNGKRQKNPLPPFTTSTLQQEASKIFGYASSKTMLIAQQLYEGISIKGEGTVGLVSYIRTDSVRISDEAYLQAKDFVISNYGEEFFEKERRKYKAKGKTQDAHEAIRPTYTDRTPDSIKESLSAEQYKIYKLIWERFLASQMTPASYITKTIKIKANGYDFRATGSLLDFEGYLKVYKKNEEKAKENEEDILIPDINKNQELEIKEIKPLQHFTQPPARYTEATLIKTLEEIGVGRPSTYAPTISTITARNYVTKEQKVFYKTELGEIVNDIIKNNFGNVINVDFTAKMENKLDEIEEGHIEWKEVLREFYPPFESTIEEAYEKIEHIEIEDEKTDILCEKCGANMVIKYGKFGKFLACPNFPECSNTKPFYEEAGVTCVECGGKVLIKKTKKGRKFYGCENNPECEFMSWNKPTGERCPKCNSFLIEKGTKKKIICCSNDDCGYYLEKEEK
ncbi:type I DNA topoisomerase [uncultured Tyzzerella sp.]|uniref:type I DNA topoisomerase n=1 Tax=uncultured Tyzzerella sp. TaxID=2321398 RepID=UPI0029428739|nr:type I DNA topoisomerase [uncultured Tyzzerella sp.]